MNKKILVVSVSIGLIAAMFFLMSLKGKSQNAPLRAAEEQKKAAGRFILEGEDYEKEGKYLEAGTVYRRAIEESGDSRTIKDAEERLYNLNMKILFSSVMTADSQKYVVIKGDSLDRISRQFNTTVELLKKSNRLSSDLIKPGMELKVSRAKYSVVVDRSQNILFLKSNDSVLKTYEVSTGKNESTPLGNFKVTNKLISPTWYSTGAVVSPDSPENILGSRWIGISRPGYGIHGTTEPESIGNHVTAGCIRMYNKEVEELFSIIPVGTEITIVN